MANIKEYIDSGIVIKKGIRYYLKDGDIHLGKSITDAEAKLVELKIELPTTEIETRPDQPDLAKKLEVIKESTEEHDIYSSMYSDLQDIRSFGREGVFHVYISGIDSRLDTHPVVMACPFVFSWRLVSKNVNSGTVIVNEGWTVLRKSQLMVDKRTGNRVITTNRDDSPKEDFIRVGNLVLCYADKTNYKQLMAERQSMNSTRTGEMADARMEHSKKMAILSKEDAVLSAQGYQNQNRADKAQTIEYLSQGSVARADEAIDAINSLDSLTIDGESVVEKPRSKSIVSMERISFDNL